MDHVLHLVMTDYYQGALIYSFASLIVYSQYIRNGCS